MFYNGQDDSNCDYEGVNNYLNMLDWPDIKKFRKSPRRPWHFKNGTVTGLVKSYGNVTFAFINKAGRMVPWYQRESALILLDHFINGVPLTW